MPKPPLLRNEVLAYLERLPQPIMKDLTSLHADWLADADRRGLAVGATNDRAFRMVIDKLESLGNVRVIRERGWIVGLEVTEAPAPDKLTELRLLERERATISRRFIPVGEETNRELLGMRTPHLNDYVRSRRIYERVYHDFVVNGLDPSTIDLKLDPLGEEALALKLRVLRLEVELLAWREAGAKLGFSPDLSGLTATYDAPGEDGKSARPSKRAAKSSAATGAAKATPAKRATRR